MKYAVVYEKSENGYAAHAPDVPGCIAAGDTLEETATLFREALTFHFEGLRGEGLPIPTPTAHCEYVAVDG